MPIPYLKPTATSQQLIVNGEPYLMLAAELQNSALTSAKYMQEVWPKLRGANINTALGCVTWEQIEPEEGKFDFAVFDKVVADARAAEIHLVLLWFGSFKNGISTYTPAWMKTDQKRFPRAKLRQAHGELKTGDVLSIFHTAAQEADVKAFTKLMEHVKDIDEKHSTILMVQVENETGLLGDSRDGGPAAEKRFNEPVPSDVLKMLNAERENLRPELQQTLRNFSKSSKGSWPEVFGQSRQTDELFMAYYYAIYLEQVASAGKSVYPIPLYTNVWQNYVGADADPNMPVVVGGGGTPGEYPSGGGVVNVLDVWQMFAPSLDFIAPDVYLNDYATSCAKYRHRNQPLFIPEQRRDEYGARRIWTAYGTYAALGTSPFGIDTLTPETNPFRRHYALMNQVSKHVLAAQRDQTSVGFFFDELNTTGVLDTSPPTHAKFGPWNLTIERSFVFGKAGPGWGMVIHQGGAKFMLIGCGFQVKFKHESAGFTGILSFDEKEVAENGDLSTLRMLNGDETRGGGQCIMPNDEPDYGGFPICVTIPARTCVAECEAYALEDE
ncbi:hypothetical protein LTR08_002885 [Meristemomyces frigidus]|nr:hypothetical protein LTR08_002885 [Meristemomyces frigidus]